MVEDFGVAVDHIRADDEVVTGREAVSTTRDGSGRDAMQPPGGRVEPQRLQQRGSTTDGVRAGCRRLEFVPSELMQCPCRGRGRDSLGGKQRSDEEVGDPSFRVTGSDSRRHRRGCEVATGMTGAIMHERAEDVSHCPVRPVHASVRARGSAWR